MQTVEKCFRPLIGMPCWRVSYDIYANLSMEFGEPHLRILDVYGSKSALARRIVTRRSVIPAGRWTFWLRICYWTISSKGKSLATFSSGKRRMEDALRFLNGQKLVSVAVNPQTGATTLVFDLNGCLRARRFSRTSDEQLWCLYQPSGYCLSVRGNGTYDHAPGSGTDGRPAVIRRALAVQTTIGLT